VWNEVRRARCERDEWWCFMNGFVLMVERKPLDLAVRAVNARGQGLAGRQI
jgi:hypothetical protein